jgi:hypothetical protein
MTDQEKGFVAFYFGRARLGGLRAAVISPLLNPAAGEMVARRWTYAKSDGKFRIPSRATHE